MEGMIYSEEALEKMRVKMQAKMNNSSVKADLSCVRRCIKHGMYEGNILPLDIEYCLKLNKLGGVTTGKERRWLRRALAVCKEFGDVIQFEPRQ